MKSIIMPKTVHVDEEIRKQLLQEVKETLATGFGVKHKRFTAGDLWNLRKNARTTSDRLRR
jgi:hypothetical protein